VKQHLSFWYSHIKWWLVIQFIYSEFISRNVTTDPWGWGDRAPEAGFRELPVALPVVPQRVGDGSGMLRNGYRCRRFFHGGVRRGGGRGGIGGGTRRSDWSERRGRVVDGVEEEARAESPRGGGGCRAAPPHGGCRCGRRQRRNPVVAGGNGNTACDVLTCGGRSRW
jgi:hypothetical protein